MIQIQNNMIKRWIYIFTGFFVIWTGAGVAFCYEMGKHGLGNIDWLFVSKMNIPVLIAGLSFIFSGIKKAGSNG